MNNEMIRLGDVATYINGYAFKPKDRGDVGLPIIRIQDLTGNAYDLGFYNGEYPKKVEINDGDILISWSASLGVYIWNKGKALLNQHIFKVVFDKAEIDKDYFVYAVRKKIVEMGMKTHGATMKHITKSNFESILIPYPSLTKQKQIANNLNKVSKVIEARNQQLKLLDTLIKARFVEMFGDPVLNTFKWNRSLLRDVTSKIGSGATPKGGKESYRSEGISLIRSMNVHDGKFKYKDLAHITEKQAKQLNNVIVEENDVLVNITGASIARTCVVPKNVLPARVNQHVAIIRCDCEQVQPVFLNNLFLNIRFKKMLLSMGENGGATRQAITKQQLENIDVIVPPLSLQNEFADFVQQIDKLRFGCRKLLAKSKNIQNLNRNTIMLERSALYGK
ncbi:restriction endonuclease subunit S [uncultured Enterococcus sp.]|uniref:restriction endonuclease subunit S n=1 Tax=uncultured Enterococcus sp. TaxID=167972 RepID=UPI0026236C52|nr:restriction endonuclease subunit S [uncultured Enterococcus sp.]